MAVPQASFPNAAAATELIAADDSEAPGCKMNTDPDYLYDEITRLARDDVERAMQVANLLVQQDRGSARSWSSLAYVQARAGNMEGCITSLKAACELSPNEPIYAFSIGVEYLKLKQYEEAYFRFDESIKLSEFLNSEYYLYDSMILSALCLIRLKRKSDAFDLIERIPSDVSSWHKKKWCRATLLTELDALI